VGSAAVKPAYGRSGIRHTGGLSLKGSCMERVNLGVDANGEVASGWTDATPRDYLVVVMKRSNVRGAKG
jgi:hypothetical protein